MEFIAFYIVAFVILGLFSAAFRAGASSPPPSRWPRTGWPRGGWPTTEPPGDAPRAPDRGRREWGDFIEQAPSSEFDSGEPPAEFNMGAPAEEFDRLDTGLPLVPASEAVPTGPVSEERWLATPEDLVRGVALAEILAPARARRPWGGGVRGR